MAISSLFNDFFTQETTPNSEPTLRGYCGLAPEKPGRLICVNRSILWTTFRSEFETTASKWQPWLFQESKGDGGFEGFAWTILAENVRKPAPDL